MATREKPLYRCRDGKVFGGICAGLAEYFDVDVLVIRILVVALAILSFGIVAVAYIALWVVLPWKDDTAASIPVDVKYATSYRCSHPMNEPPRTAAPREDASIPRTAASAPTQPFTTQASAQTQPFTAGVASAYVPNRAQSGAPTGAYAGAGHVPPTPPQQQGTQPFPAQPAAPHVVTSVAPEPSRHAGVRSALWLALLIVAVFGAFMIDELSPQVRWWMMWPLVCAIGGIVQLVVPDDHRSKSLTSRILECATGCAFAIVALLFTTGLCSVFSLDTAFLSTWPILAAMVTCYIVGAASKLTIFNAVGAVLFVVFLYSCSVICAVPSAQIDILFPTGALHLSTAMFAL